MSQLSMDSASSQAISFGIVCDIAGMTSGTIHTLEQFGFVYAETATILIVMDAPYGFAMRYLASHNHIRNHIIVTTGNTFSEYWADLNDFAPAILLVGPNLGRELVDALVRAERSERYQIIHAPPSRLSSTQRRILRHLAAGESDRQIAQQIGLSEKRVRNMLSQIYHVLGCSGRTEAALKYWGVQYHYHEPKAG